MSHRCWKYNRKVYEGRARGVRLLYGKPCMLFIEDKDSNNSKHRRNNCQPVQLLRWFNISRPTGLFFPRTSYLRFITGIYRLIIRKFSHSLHLWKSVVFFCDILLPGTIGECHLTIHPHRHKPVITKHSAFYPFILLAGWVDSAISNYNPDSYSQR